MHRARPLEHRPQAADDRGAADVAAPRSTPLELVSAAVAGGDLGFLADAASEATGRPIAIVIPTLGEPLAAPAGAIADEQVREVVQHAAALIAGEESPAPAEIADTAAVRVGQEIVGIVAASATKLPDAAELDVATVHEWLEAAAAASAVTALMRSAQEGGLEGSRRALLQALSAGPPANVEAFVSHARRLGFDLGSGAVAVCARRRPGNSSSQLPHGSPALLADLGDGRVYGLVPLASTLAVDGSVQTLSSELAAIGMDIALSAPRRDPAALHDALREAELLLELGPSHGHDQTYRLLVGILFRDPGELEQLRAQTISSLATYDHEHDTELVDTLREFLLHHGSTTETAEAMQLHRHTVGYRLARVHEVSGLSPYESEGRERLSLGLKAHQILKADQRLSES